MYDIFLFCGGVYRFDELKEAVEDMGGLVLKEDLFHIRRGVSFLANEVEAILIIPVEDEDIIKSLSKEIKGHLKKLDLEESKKEDVLTYISIYDTLTKSRRWMTLDEIKNSIECPCPSQLCKNQDREICVLDQIDESIEKFCDDAILKSRKNDKPKYNLK